MGTRVILMSRGWVKWTSALLLAICIPAGALAIDKNVRLADLQRSHWSRLQGAPANAQQVVTTSDGMLWLIGGSGVHRFDGVRFHLFVPFDSEALAGGSLTLAMPGAQGGLWLGHSNGELTHVHGHDLTRHPAVQGIHDGAVRALEIDSEGRLWVVTKAGLAMREGERWRLFGKADGIEGSQVDDINLGADGRVWVLTDTGLFVGAAGNRQFSLVEPVNPASHMSGLLVQASGKVWRWNLLGNENLCRLVPQDKRGCWRAGGLNDPKFDDHGALWWGSAGTLSRLVDPDRLGKDPDDLARHAEHLDVHAEALTFGVDGSLWVAESTGVTRLRQTPLQHLHTPSGALAPANAAK